MKKLLLLAVPAALAAAPAFAADTGTVDINGSVAGRCLFTTPNKTITLGELALGGIDGNAGKLDTAKVNGKSETLVGWCNASASTMSVTATELTGPTGTASGFDKRVDYTATAVANSVPATDTSTVTGAGSNATVGMFTGNVVVTLSAASTPTSGLLMAGSYTGNVAVTLTPAS